MRVVELLLGRVGPELCQQPAGLRVPALGAGERGGEDEALEPLGPGEGIFLREHPAPRGAEEVEAVEAERVPHGLHLGDEELERPERVVAGPVGVAAAELVVPDDLAAGGEWLEALVVGRRRAGAAVQAQERERAGRALADDAVPRAVAAKRDETFRHYAAGTMRRTSTGSRKKTSSRTGATGGTSVPRARNQSQTRRTS